MTWTLKSYSSRNVVPHPVKVSQKGRPDECDPIGQTPIQSRPFSSVIHL